MKDDADYDRLFAAGRATPGGFRFDAAVARVFEDMIARSVPGYAETVAMTGWLARRFATPGTAVVDLGCSLGASLFACARALGDRPGRLVGVDASAAMLDGARGRLAVAAPGARIEFVEADVRSVELPPASFVVLNWTLQFVPVTDRPALLRRIREALVPGGALVLSEKVVEIEPDRQALLERLHHDFKRAQGYSELEIAGKRTAIEDVLVPEALATHRERLQAAGFTTVATVSRTLDFATVLATLPEPMDTPA